VFKPGNSSSFAQAANEAVKSERRIGAWIVWSDYEVVECGPPEDAYVQPAEDAEPEVYYPLAQVPGLFLEFAQLADEGEITRQVWLDWIKRYGVLGLNWRDPVADAALVGLYGPVSLEGGPAESHRNFASEARKANRVLRLYEAVASPREPQQAPVDRWAEAIEEVWEGTSVAGARRQVLGMLHDFVRVEIEECYPVLHYFSTEERFVQGWGFRTLPAAMYLQMTWLLTATGDQVKRCARPECDKVITFEQPAQVADHGMRRNDRSKGYRTRRDKDFCSDNCRAKYHYHYVKKGRSGS
jgi:hypothetical protein